VGGQIVFALPKYLLQGIIGIFVLYAVWGPKMKAMEPSRIRFAVVGAVASFATMFAGATGPLIAPFIKASTTDRMMTVATHAAFMSWQHGVKILAFGFLGFAFGPYVPLMGLMILFGVIGTWSGKFILNWMAESVFRRGFNLVLTVLALRLLFEAGTEVIG
ncbi:MAG: sulfite exporter TauE/SafE family protein, partial [Rhodospirillaceae bacterium]|nr:sulfite exporter TauE/SafE family protein [Rhodospirillaceae bacterium]